MKIATILFLSTLVSSLFAQSNLVKTTAFVDSKQLENASIGILLTDTQSGDVLFSSNAHKSLTPASVLKLITTATAIEQLGENFQFKTDVILQGHEIVDRIFMGNILIKGYGDPTLESKYFKADSLSFIQHIYHTLTKAGIKGIKGSVLYDDKLFGTNPTPGHWSWEDIGNYYAAPPSALSYKDNTINVYFKTSNKIGEVAQLIKTIPSPIVTEFESEITGENIRNDQAYFYGDPFHSFRLGRGSIPKNRSSFLVKASMPQPGRQLVFELNNFLKAQNFIIGNKTLDTDSSQVIYTHNSPYLKDIIRLTNQKSINLFAENTFLYLINSATKPTKKHTQNYWKTKECNTNGVSIQDGSGLSWSNTVTCQFLNDVLVKMYHSKNYPSFKNSLAIAGKKGTLRNMGKQSVIKEKVFAKSGSLRGVKAYAGYVEAKNGKTYAFSIIVNKFSIPSSVLQKEITKLLEEWVLLNCEYK